MKESPWQLATPPQSGIYQTAFKRVDGKLAEGYSHWSGVFWSIQYQSRDVLLEAFFLPLGPRQDKMWKKEGAMILTGWFPSHMKPVRPGVYQTKWEPDQSIGYSYWNGKRWSVQSSSITKAINQQHKSQLAKIWRGILEETKD